MLTRRYARAAVILGLLLFANAARAADGGPVTFPAQKQAMKIVIGEDGTDFGDYAGFGSKLLAYLGDLDMNMTRVGVNWRDVEKVRGTYDWTLSDNLINFWYDRGVDFEFTIIGSPAWARITRPDDEEQARELEIPFVYLDLPKDECLKDLSNWAEALARRYKGKVRCYEWWNEPDGMAGTVLLRDKSGRIIWHRPGGDPVHYARTLKAVHDGLKRGNPDAVLAAGSLSVFNTGFMEAIYATVGKDAFEAISYHPYSDEAGMDIPWTEALRALCVRYGDLDCGLWINEYTWNPESRKTNSTTYGIGPGAEKLPMDGVSLAAQYPYVTHVLLHTLNDWGGWLPPASNPDAGMGLTTSEPKPKPKYESFRQVQLWRRDSLSRELTLRGPHVVFPETDFELSLDPSAASSIGKVEWAVPNGWTVRPGKNDGSFIFRAPAGSASPRPHPLTAQRADGAAFTRYIEVVEPVQLTRAILKAGARGSSLAKVEMIVLNLASKPISASPKLELPAGWTCADTGAGTLRPGESRWKLEVKAPADAKPGVYPCKAYVVRDGRASGEYEFQLAVEAPARLAATPFQIDGDLSDWSGAEWIPIPGEAPPARFATAWDSKFLYLACAATKTTRSGNVRVGIDAAHDAVPGSVYSYNDQELVAKLRDGESFLYRIRTPQGWYGGLLTIPFKAAHSGNETTYEMAIPWEEIKPAQPRDGTSVGLAVVVEGWYGDDWLASMWGKGVGEPKRPIDFGWVRLVR